jgi:hypothetical protein
LIDFEVSGPPVAVDDAAEKSGGVEVDHFRRSLRGQAVAEDVRLPVLPKLQKRGANVMIWGGNAQKTDEKIVV